MATLAQDSAASIEELMKLALQRLQRAGSGKEARIVGGEEITLVKPASLPSDIERAVQVLEQASAERLGEASNEVLRRLLPFLQGAFKRVKIDLPVEKISSMLSRK